MKVLYLEQSFLFFAGFRSGIFNNYCEEPFFTHEMEFASISFKLIFISCILAAFVAYASSGRIGTSFYKFYVKYYLSDTIIVYIRSLYKAAIFRNIYFEIGRIVYYISFRWFLEIVDRGALEKLGSLGIVENLYMLCNRMKSLHAGEGSFVGSLFNFWFIIYLSILLYVKIMSGSALLSFIAGVLIMCSLMHYVEMVWKALDNAYEQN